MGGMQIRGWVCFRMNLVFVRLLDGSARRYRSAAFVAVMLLFFLVEMESSADERSDSGK